MIKVEKIEVWGFEHSVRGLRNPMNSWDRSDSKFDYDKMCLGENDLTLMRKLYTAGQPHRKYLRQIFVSMDITAPLYWWKEFDTYKVGTTANSCSTMHKITAKEFDVNDFSHEHIEEFDGDEYNMSYDWLLRTVDILNYYRKKYNTASEKLKRDITDEERKHVLAQQKFFWWQLIQLLPSSYNQRRTVTMTYENVMNMLDYREGHKLDEWCKFCEILRELPYVTKLRDPKGGKPND